MMNTSVIAIGIGDKTGRILEVNDAFLAFCGYSREEIFSANTTWRQLTAPEYHKIDDNLLLQLEKSGAIGPFEKEYIRKDGTRVPALVSVALIPGQSGEHVAFMLDITERKQAEEQLKQINEELQRSNTDLQQFAYVASHDLREPLRAINGFMELLKQRYEEKLDEKANEYINYAANGAKRMDDLLTGLLAYSRVQTHGKPRAPIPAQAALNAAVTNLQRSFAESKAAITADPLPEVKADGMQFTQLLQNLIQNAIKFKGDKRPEIHVGCKRHENGWLFSIRDNGIGIDPQIPRTNLRDFPAASREGQIPRLRCGPCYLQTNRRTSRRENLGRIRTGKRLNLLLHNPRLNILYGSTARYRAYENLV